MSDFKARGLEIQKRLADFKDFENDEAYNALVADYKAYEAERDNNTNINDWAAKIAGSNSTLKGNAPMTGQNTIDDVSGLSYEELAAQVPNLDGTVIKTRGLHVDPATFNDRVGAKNVADAIIKAVTDGSRVQAKAFTSASSLVPPDLSLPIQERIYDVDIMSYLPVITGTGSTFRYVKDPSTTGVIATVVAEGAAKPQNVVTYTNVDTAYAKLAEYITLSHETITDYPQSLGVTVQRAMNDVISERNLQLVSGSGASGNLDGLVTAAGSTIAVPGSLPTGVTQLDYFIQGVDTLRVASGVFAVADLVLLHPSTWHSLLLLKDSLGRPLLNPEQGVAASFQIAGVPVKISTDVPAGTAVMLDTSRYGYVVVRESMLVLDGYNASDFIENLRSWVIETRLTQIVTRPTAICTITGLETTFTI
jgi:HK97 family phage major capsid protein